MRMRQRRENNSFVVSAPRAGREYTRDGSRTVPAGKEKDAAARHVRATAGWLAGACLILSFAAARAAAPPAMLALQDAFAALAAKAKPAVVNISVVQEQRIPAPNFFFGDPEDFFEQFMRGSPHPRTYRASGTGSGFIVDAKGHVLTNWHVIRNATDIRVTLTQPDGKEKTYPGKVIQFDTNLDLAVVKIKAAEDFPYLTFAAKAPRVGDWAVAIGSPFGLQQTVTSGIISAVRQSLPVEGRSYQDMIQTDAAINQGNSGGPLLNIDGEVIGVNTAIYSPSGASAGIGFAIPAGAVQSVLGYLLSGKQMRHGWLGVESSPVDEVIQRRFALPAASGALINSVFAGSPAQKAGLKRGDVITRFNGEPVNDHLELASRTIKVEAGGKVDFQVYRKGTPMNITVVLGDRPERINAGAAPPAGPQDEEQPERESVFRWQGAEFAQQEQGVVVAQIEMRSPLAGYLRRGDVVRAVNQTEVEALDELRAAVEGVKLSDGVFLDILRQGQPLYISIRP